MYVYLYWFFRWKTLMNPIASTMKPCTIFASVPWNLPTLLMEIWTIWFPWPCQVKFFFRRRPQKISKNLQFWKILLNFCGLIRNHELYDSTVILFQGTISKVERFQSMEENMVQFFNHPPKTSIEINSIQSHIEKEKQLIKSS